MSGTCQANILHLGQQISIRNLLFVQQVVVFMLVRDIFSQEFIKFIGFQLEFQGLGEGFSEICMDFKPTCDRFSDICTIILEFQGKDVRFIGFQLVIGQHNMLTHLI